MSNSVKGHHGPDSMVGGFTTNVVSLNPTQARCTLYNVMWSGLSVTCDRFWFSPDTPISSTNKTDCHDITEILLKVTLNTITLAIVGLLCFCFSFVKGMGCGERFMQKCFDEQISFWHFEKKIFRNFCLKSINLI